MRNNKKGSIREKIIYWFIALSLIPILLIILIVYFQRISHIRNAALDKLKAIRDLKVERLSKWYEYQHYSLKELAIISSLRNIEKITINNDAAQNNDLLQDANVALNDYNNEYENFLNIYFIDPFIHEIIISTDPNAIGKNVADAEFYKNALSNAGHYHSDIYYSSLENCHTMTFATPVKCLAHNNAHIVGYLIGNIDLDHEFYPALLNKIGLGVTGETLIIDRNVIAQSELRWYFDAPLKYKIESKPATLAASGSTGTIITTDYRGVEIISAYTYLPEQEWGFVCKQDVSELSSTVNEMLIQMVVLFIAIASITILSAFWIGRSLTDPIIELDNVVTKIRAGVYSARSSINTNDEFGSLSEMINEMADSMEQRVFVRESISDLTIEIIDKSTMQDYSESLLKKMSGICNTRIANFYILDENTTNFVLINAIGKELKSFKSISVKYPKDEFKIPIKQKKAVLINKIPKNCIYRINEKNVNFIPKEIYIIPVISDSILVALVGLATENHFSESELNILQFSETVINATYTRLLALERARIFSEQLYRINEQIQEKSEEIETRATELHKQKLILQDTTKKLINKNEELEIQKRTVERANKDLESFSYSVSHDLRAPLRAIKGFSDILIEEYAPVLGEEGTRIAKVIFNNTNKMDALIKDLLELSRVGRKSRNISDVNMKEMANSMYHEVIDDETMKKIDMKIGNISKITGDPNLLRQVWANLIANAVKFSSKRDKIKINISSKIENGRVIYSVKDNGVGFDEQYQDKLFGVFQRLHSDEEFEGTGVGLALVKQIIAKHNGEIWAESTLGKGSIFYFSLPKD